MQIFNTLTRQKEEFVPQVPGEYRIYVCGPTVYNYIHIGNARPLIVFDTLRRYLEYRGNKVIYVKQFKFRRSVIDRYGQIVCNIVAERRNGGIVIRSAPFSEEIRKAINKHFCTRFFCIVKKQFFAREFGLAVIRLSVSADKRRLHGRRKHNGTGIFCFFERSQER